MPYSGNLRMSGKQTAEPETRQPCFPERNQRKPRYMHSNTCPGAACDLPVTKVFFSRLTLPRNHPSAGLQPPKIQPEGQKTIAVCTNRVYNASIQKTSVIFKRGGYPL